MSDSVSASPAPRRGRRWLRVLAWVFGGLIVLIITVYFIATSSAFFKGVILPKVSKAMGATVTVSDASISPFKSVVLHNLKVETTGTEPLLSASEVRLRYSLMDILGGNLHVDEITVNTPAVSLIENPDGTSNLDPLLRAQQATPGEKKPAQPAKTAAPSKPPQLDLKKIALVDATIRKVKLYKGGTRDVMELAHVNVTLDDVKNGQAGKLALSAGIALENNPPSPGTAGILQGELKGDLSLTLAADLKTASVQGSTHFTVARAEGVFAQAAGLKADLDCDVTPDALKQVALSFQKGGAQLGQLKVSGPFNQQTHEGRLTVSILGIDKQLLNLAGAGGGLDFGPTTLNSTNQIELAHGGAALTLGGQLRLDKFQVTRNAQTTPAMDLRLDYELSVDSGASQAVLRAFTLAGTQKGNLVFSGELSGPMTFAWGSGAGTTGDSTLNLAITHLDLADWKAFLGDTASGGDVNLKLQLVSQQGGKQLGFDVTSHLDNLAVNAGGHTVGQVAVTLQTKGKAIDLKQVEIANLDLKVLHANQPLFTLTASGTCDQGTGNADFQCDAQALLARLLELAPQPSMAVSSGTVELKAHLRQTSQPASGNQPAPPARSITGDFAMSDFTGQIGSNSFKGVGVKMQVDASLEKQVANLRQFQVMLTPTSRATNRVQLTGQVDMSNTNAIQGNLTLSADSLDLTTYYDMFAGPKPEAAKPAAQAPSPAPAPAATAGPEKEPEAKQFPVRNFTVAANIRRLWLHEMDITDFQTTMKMDGGHVVVNPFKLALNGAPVSAQVDFDMGVPGYKYNLSFNAQAVPLAPLVNSFQPDQKNVIAGTLTGQATIAGAGITGAGLQKNLTGQYDISSTNLNLAIANVKSKYLKPVLVIVTEIPDLVQNPLGKGASLLGGLTGVTSASTNDLSKSPIEAIVARGDMGAGKINLKQTMVQSPAFQIGATGTIGLAPILTNSTLNIPITVALLRSVAQQLYLAPANTPADVTYVQLPPYITETGTLGVPSQQRDKSALVKLAIQVATGALGGKGSAGQILQGAQGLLGGNTAAPGAAGANTNRANNNLGGMLQGLLGRNGTATTNAPSTTTTNQPAPNQSPANNLLDRFLGPGKK